MSLKTLRKDSESADLDYHLIYRYNEPASVAPKGKYMFDLEKPLVVSSVIDNAIVTLTPNIEIDKWKNPISSIAIQEFGKSATTYRIVHHPSKSQWRTSASIYGGKDRFLRFSTYEHESDLRPHTITLISELGEFSAWYGDGDFGGFDIPENLKTIPSVADLVKEVNKKLPSNDVDESEELFFAYVLPLILEIGNLINRDVWLSKASWEAMKLKYQEERNERRRNNS